MEDVRTRSKRFALEIVKIFSVLPKTTEAQVIGKQFLRCGASVGAHCHEGFRARSKNEFVAKLEGGLQELEETVYWLELMIAAEILSANSVSKLMQEANELTAILVTISKKTKANS